MKKTEKEYNAPWEKAFNQVLTPLEEFIHSQTTSGVLLMLCAVIALVIANSPLQEGFHHLLENKFAIGSGDLTLSMSIHHWVNDGLMAIFFFVVGLELKRELLVGELSELKKAMLPIIAAIGGMLLPAAFYLAVNPEGSTFNGWGIPMATDIAFALGALALLGNRVPATLLTFLVALAIVDDLGAVVVIALFYTEQLNMLALGIAAVLLVILVAMNLGGIRRPLPFMLLGLLLWLAFLKSGVHATLAGVFLAFTIPMRPKFNLPRFVSYGENLFDEIKSLGKSCSDPIRNSALRARIQALSDGARMAQAPAQVLEHKMHVPSAYLIIPIFALANAAIPVDFSVLGSTIMHPVALGVMAGLIIGKLLGIAGFVWVAVKMGISPLPAGLNFNHIFGVGLLGGIGFTMSIFIAELAFAHHPEDLLMAKTGILLASLIAGFGGYFWLYFTCKNPDAVADDFKH